jgi:hypothetical protein
LTPLPKPPLGVLLALGAGFLALTGLLAGTFFAGLRGEAPEPLEAVARIFFSVSAEGRLSWDVVFLGEAGVSLAVLFDREARTVALIRPVALTVGSLTLVFDLTAVVVLPFAVVLVVFFPRTAATAFFTPALMDLDLIILRFLPCGASSSLSASSEAFRFFPMTFLAVVVFGLPSAFRFSSSLARCCFSFSRGPRKPRQFADPQRHS